MDSNATQTSDNLQMIEIAESKSVSSLFFAQNTYDQRYMRTYRVLWHKNSAKDQDGERKSVTSRFHIERRGQTNLFLLSYDCSIKNEIETCAVKDLIQ